ncbi:phenoloxidase-activating factor 3-like [Drosophila elegans]|uniref:phenoloxidase-activating factor 3-like n=1 Tax=Drosophila elegans TaxID=30023 RepID=UPI0007E76B70|nr:phenoloxidase-activating factor 3-like [Drosophila elegans]
MALLKYDNYPNGKVKVLCGGILISKWHILTAALCIENRADVGKNNTLNDNHICAEGSDIKHSCKGDSGGPIFYVHKFTGPDTYRYVQYGVTSTGGDLCGKTKKQMEIFTSVISMLPWITQNVL